MREHVPEFVSIMEQFTAIDENSIQAYALKVGSQVIVKEGQFDPVKDMRVNSVYKQWR